MMPTALLTIRPLPGYRFEAFAAGLKRTGFAVTTEGYMRAMPKTREDLLVLWNLRRGIDEAYAQRWEAAGGIVLVCENGYLQKVDKTYYAISTHGHNGSGWWPAGDGSRFAKLGFELKPTRDSRQGYILVRDQRGIGSALMASPPGWGQRTANKLRAKTKQPVKLMAHPGDKGKLEKDLDALAGAGFVHIWSSAIGVRALVDGIGVQHHAPAWVCASHVILGRQEALEHMAWAQWHHEEIAAGEPFAAMRGQNWGR